MQAQYSSKFTILMSLGIAFSVYRIVTEPPSWQAIVIMVLLCYFVTDMVSGLLHIILDNPRSLDIKFIAPLAQGFQNHHPGRLAADVSPPDARLNTRPNTSNIC